MMIRLVTVEHDIRFPDKEMVERNAMTGSSREEHNTLRPLTGNICDTGVVYAGL